MRVCSVFFLVAAGTGKGAEDRVSRGKSYETQTVKHRLLDQFRKKRLLRMVSAILLISLYISFYWEK